MEVLASSIGAVLAISLQVIDRAIKVFLTRRGSFTVAPIWFDHRQKLLLAIF